jgi:hypothetical protein
MDLLFKSLEIPFELVLLDFVQIIRILAAKDVVVTLLVVSLKLLDLSTRVLKSLIQLLIQLLYLLSLLEVRLKFCVLI